MTTPDDILLGHSPTVIATAEALRVLLLDTVPTLREKPYPGWHGIGYRHPTAGYVCGIYPREASVRLQFQFGSLLADPDGVFSDMGTKTRTIEIASPAEIPVDAVRRLLLEAIAL